LYVKEGDDLAPFIMEQAEGLLAERFDKLAILVDDAEEYEDDIDEGKYKYKKN